MNHAMQPPHFSIVLPLIMLVIGIFMLAVMWKIYTKAGKPGWASIVPIYNVIVLLEMINRPLWWILLLFIPLVNFIVLIMIIVDLAKAFGKSVGFAIGMIVLGIVFYPLLAFGDAEYIGIQRD